MISKIVTLGDVCNKGSSNIAQKDLVDRDGIYPIYGAAGYIKNVDFAHQDKPYLAVVKDGAGIGRVMKLPANSSIIGTMQYILPKGNIDIDYLYFALQYMNLSKYFSGSTIPHIYFRDYQKEKLPLPELSEQQGKAYVLLRIEQLIECYRQQLTKLDELVKSRFIELFGDAFEHTKLTIGDISEESTVGIANSATHAYSDSGVVLLRNQNIRVNSLDDSDLIYITEEFASNYKNKALKANDILVTRTGANVGMACIVPPKYEGCQTFTTLILRLKKNVRISPVFVCHYINSPLGKQFIDDKKVGGAQPNFGAKQLATMPIIIPVAELQSQFEMLVEQTDKSKLAVQKTLEKLETLKKSLMQQYFG